MNLDLALWPRSFLFQLTHLLDSPAVPKECFRENIVYDVLANIVDKDFKTTNKVKYTKVIGAYTWENELTPVHTDLESDLDKVSPDDGTSVRRSNFRA